MEQVSLTDNNRSSLSSKKAKSDTMARALEAATGNFQFQINHPIAAAAIRDSTELNELKGN